MQRPRHFRRDGDMFSYPETSSRDALREPSRKRKSSYDHQRHMPAPARSTGFNRRAGPKTYADDFRDKEFQSSIPDSSRRESSHFRDYDDSRNKDFRGSIQASPRRASSHFRDFDDLRDNEFQSSIPASPCKESSHFRDYDDLRDKEFRRFIPNSPRRQSSRFRGYDDLRDKEFQSSIPAAPHRESSHSRDSRLRDKEFRSCLPVSSRRQPSQFRRDYPRKTHSCDKKNYAESCHSDKSDDYYSTKSEYTEHGSFRGHTYPKDSPPLSVGQIHRTSKWASSLMENSHQFEYFEANAQKAKDKSVSHFPKLWDRHGPEKPDQTEAFTSSCHDQSSCKNIGKCQGSITGGFGVNIHGRDRQTFSGSRWSPSRAEAGTHESNAHVATEDKASDFEEFWNSGAQKPKPEQMACSSCDIGSKILKESQSLQQDLHKAVGFDKTGWQTHTVWPHEHCDPESNREQHASNFEEFGPQHLASGSHEQASLNMKASQSFKQNFCSTGSLGVHVDARSCNEETHKAESSSTISGFDNIKMCGDNVPSSQDLQNETNRLLQNALRLLSAASGIVSADNSGGKQVQTQDDVKIMKLLLDSGIQNLKHSLVDTTVSKSIEASPKFDKSGLSNEEQDSVRLDDQCKFENKASAFTEKLWDGTLQLSTAVSVSAVAFFKSGEKMQDFSWSGSVEVKGKVRLEAFEKYVQDLPRSRSRGLMVVSFCCKDGSSDKGLKGMNEIAEKYKERKKVGFAQVSNAVDLYICPHSDAVITILAKHGFFKGMAAVRDKSDPLIGCVVWRKNPCSSILPALKNNMELESMANKKKNGEVSEGEGGATKGDKHLEASNMELDKLNNVQPPTVADNSAASDDDDDDDDDLPEYDFGAACLGNQYSNFVAVDSAEKLKDSGVPRPLSTLTGSESSGLSKTIPDSHFQGGIGQHSPSLSLPMQPQKQIRECKESSKLADEHLQGPVPQKQSVGGCKPSSLFDDEDDDDDIPEWCPPGFTKPSVDLELVAKEGAGSSSSSIMVTHSHSKVADSNSRPAAAAVVPPLPPTPPPAHLQLQLQTKQYPTCAAPLPLPLLPTSSIPNIPNNPPLPPPPPGFLHHNNHPEFLQNHAPRPHFGPGHAARSPFDPRGFPKPPHHLPWRPSPPGSGP